MNGAREYAKLFHTGQHGRLYFVSSSHARGKTFRIFVLPAGELAIPNGIVNAPLNKDAVEVYGIVGGNPGWTESYGWLHEGPWQDDFKALADTRRLVLEKQAEINHQRREDLSAHDAERIKGLLSNY